ncbi:MAG TPA: hypothetical protein PK926_07175 [Spirochaetota bacterium]|nr:hypothetical protein [Spirochaetota bacterium]HPI90397.1 hypothetical protein [Spirochaetota bacterium]HPR48520.1 hypothetical protein [Spirochaetota bacterium]
MNRTELFEKFLDNYRFTRPVPVEVRRHVLIHKNSQFAVILKKAGGYSLAFGLVTSLFFSLKKLGLGVTIVKSAVILAAVTAASVAVIGLGAYASAQYIIRIIDKEKISVEADKHPPSNIEESFDPRESAEVAGRIGIQVFSAENTEKTLSAEVTDIIAGELARLRGEQYTVNVRKTGNIKRYRMMLIGSVEQKDDSFIVVARVSDVTDSRLLFYTSEEIQSREKINAASKTIARKIAEALPVNSR